MSIGLIGRKIGMTRIVNEVGNAWPMTLVQVGPGTITKVINKEKGGYDAVQIGFEEKKDKHTQSSQKGYFKKNNLKNMRVLKEFRVANTEEIKDLKVGAEVSVDTFAEGDYVDVRGTTIGKGFQGVIRRWNMARGPESHGSMSHRQIGSIGMSATPSRTLRGHKMPGHMGNVNRTIQNLLVIKVLKDENVLGIKGAIPGHKGSIVYIQKAKKKSSADLKAVASKEKGVSTKVDGKKTAKAKKK